MRRHAPQLGSWLLCVMLVWPAWLPCQASPLARWSGLAAPAFQHLGTDQGLPHPLVSSLAQDGAGFVWIGTQGGLARWDGYRMRLFLPNGPSSLPDAIVQTLYTDRKGQLWVGTNGAGLVRYDAQQDRMLRIPLGRGNQLILALADDGHDGMWVGTQGGLAHYPGHGKSVQQWQHDEADPASLPSDSIRALLMDQTEHLWLGTRKGLVRRDAQTGRFIAVPLPGNTPAPLILSLLQSRDGRIWIGTADHGAYYIDPGSTSPKALPQTVGTDDSGQEIVACITETGAGEIWLGTFGKGVLVVSPDSLRTRRIRHDPTNPDSLANNTVQALMLDHSGLLWIGGQRGVSRIDPQQTAILTLPGGGNGKTQLVDTDITAVHAMADGRIWLGMQSKGIHIIDPDSSQLHYLAPHSDQGEAGLPPVEIRSFTEPLHGQVYVATSRGLYRCDVSCQHAERVNLGTRDPAHPVAVLQQDGEVLWLGGRDGLWRLVPGQTVQAEPAPGSAALAKESVESMLASGNGQIWIGTRSHGLFLYDSVRGVLHAFSASSETALTHGFVATLLQDRRGRIWIGTQGNGIFLLPHGIAGPIGHISSAQGLPNDLVNKLLEDDHGSIWASTDGGLARIDPGNLKVHTLQRADGVQVPGYWTNSGVKTLANELLFGGTGGLTIVRPQHLRNWDFHPPVVITDIHIGGKMVPSSQLNPVHASADHHTTNSATHQTSANPHFAAGPVAHLLPWGSNEQLPLLHISPDANSISVEFAALDYSFPQHNRYAWWLEGYDRGWTDTDATRRVAAYTNLPPGEYRLHLKGSNRNGAWSQSEALVRLVVHPAWHQTWWSRLTLLLTLGLLLAGWMRWRTQKLRRRQTELEALISERTSELRQLGDIGREITTNLDAEIVFRSLYVYVGRLLDASTLTIYRMNPEQGTLELVFGHDKGQALTDQSIALDATDSYNAQAARERREMHLEAAPDTIMANHMAGTHVMQTALFAPLIVDDKVLGVMSVQSEHEHAYGEREKLIFRTLCAYGAIALANAEAMSALHQAQAQLVQQEKLASLGGMVAGIAHEINTPLGTAMMAISGVASAWRSLQEALGSGRVSRAQLEEAASEGLEYTILAKNSTSRAAELITTFMSVAVRVDNDEPVKLDLAQYLDEIAGLVRTTLENRGVTVDIAVPDGLHLTIIPDALTEALSRILANVVDHAFVDSDEAPHAWHLSLSARRLGENEVAIEIADNGIGIASSDLPRVFDPFFTTKGGGQGHVGLGLHVAYSYVVERLKGRLQIISKPGQGTRVILRLPSML